MGFRSNSAAIGSGRNWAPKVSLLRPGLLAITIITSFIIATESGHAQASRPSVAPHRTNPATPAHRVAIVEGEAQAGQAFERPIGNGLKILLEPIASGWVLRVVPAQGPRGPHDYAELATPPYQSVSPLLISTDFSFRAQDALAWNPRRFRFAAGRASFAELSAAYDQSQRVAKLNRAAEMRLAESRLALLVSRTPEAELTILDARLVQGTGDQAQSAAMVALHPNWSARQVDQPADGVATPLGRLNWLRFRIRLDLPTEFHADKSLRIERSGPL